MIAASSTARRNHTEEMRVAPINPRRCSLKSFYIVSSAHWNIAQMMAVMRVL
jgi:hypothetical protein